MGMGVDQAGHQHHVRRCDSLQVRIFHRQLGARPDVAEHAAGDQDTVPRHRPVPQHQLPGKQQDLVGIEKLRLDVGHGLAPGIGSVIDHATDASVAGRGSATAVTSARAPTC